MMPSRGYAQQQGYPPSAYQHPSAQNQHMQQQQQQQQQQPQQQLQQQAHGQGQGQGPASTVDAQSNTASGGPPQEMNLASVLHYLQSEWRRWERDRNEWEIERAEMRARIALIEGQKRAAENLKVDLMRRVKMLEYALRQERTKTVSTAGRATGIAPSKLSALQDEDKASSDGKEEGSGSEGSAEGERLKVNGIHPGTLGKMSTIASRAGSGDSSVWKTHGGPARDPKSRARSREYLKQCLQEITYLTSPGALNPLPPRPPITIDDLESSKPDEKPVANGVASTDTHEWPKKQLSDQPLPSLFAKPDIVPLAHSESSAQSNGVSERSTSIKNEDSPPEASAARVVMRLDISDSPPSSPAPRTVGLPDTESTEDAEKQILTAIYRPDSKAAWREELRAANEKAERAREDRLGSTPDEDLANLTLNIDEEDVKPEEVVDKTWTTRKVLKSHLEVVRAVAFAAGPSVTLATGGDDNTIKVWTVDPPFMPSTKTEVEPVITFRGHSHPITSIAISTPLSTIFSASLDSTIRLWHLPSPEFRDPYASYDPSLTLQVLEGHTDAVWDLCLLPTLDQSTLPPHKRHKEGRLVSASSDGSIKYWTLGVDGQWSLKATFGGIAGEDAVPTCVSPYVNDPRVVLVGTSTGLIKVVDLVSRQITEYGEVISDGSAQVNAILSHPTMSTVIAACEDGYLRFYGERSSKSPTHTLLAHPSPLTSIALSPMSTNHILTASVDCSVRLWDLTRRTSLQDLTGHRQRGQEGVCAVVSCPHKPLVASAGGDGVVRIWAAA
ncbi:WD40-repeat-containing domain protein [Naematelia encephala]|uniref:WD40-repeat-containing domain protein n=1 Tax=Naematelia encephala TaxID=71784 RepID=A0A1Y2AHE1_9TREE|nr:WD40-repeat-containing domain protein [Naematelia encephala]